MFKSKEDKRKIEVYEIIAEALGTKHLSPSDTRDAFFVLKGVYEQVEEAVRFKQTRDSGEV